MSKAKRRKVRGRGPAGKPMVMGAKDRETNRVAAQVIERKDRETMQGFVADHVAPGAKVYTDTAGGYHGMAGFDHERVNHNINEYVRGKAHTNGVESFWSMLKRGYHGTYHHMSAKHLDRYVGEFAGRHNVREADTVDQMTGLVAAMDRQAADVQGPDRLMRDHCSAWLLAGARGDSPHPLDLHSREDFNMSTSDFPASG